MNICILGIEGDNLDEGMKNFGKNLHRSLTEHGVNSKLVDVNRAIRPAGVIDLRKLNPDILHLIPGPTLQGLSALKILGKLTGSKTVVSATHPHLKSHNTRLLSVLKPDLTLVQSSQSQHVFDSAGYRTEWLPSGVDIDTFQPVSKAQKQELREKLDLPREERLFLHVGHLKRERNVLELTELSDLGTAVMIGSPSTSQQADVIDALREKGHNVYTEYVENIEKYYQAADWYVFPTRETEHSIEIPLSVLEAMACDLPIITTRFGGLPDLFEAGDGLVYVEDFSSVTEQTLPEGGTTRERVRDYSWSNTAKTALQYYQQLLQ